MWVITKPVWCRFHGKRIAAAQKMLTASRALRSVNHQVFQTPNFTASVPNPLSTNVPSPSTTASRAMSTTANWSDAQNS